MSKAKDKAETIENLRSWFPAGSTVYLVLRHKSASGMRRVIGCIAIADGLTRHPNYAIGLATGYRYDDKRAGVVLNGCGMDMGWHLVCQLGSILYGDEKALRAEWL